MKNLLKMSDLSPAELTHILDVADQLKADCKAGRTAPLLAGKSVALLFSKASTRTRTSFEVGVYQMGGASLCGTPPGCWGATTTAPSGAPTASGTWRNWPSFPAFR